MGLGNASPLAVYGLAVSTGVSPDNRVPADVPDVFEPLDPATEKWMRMRVNPWDTRVADLLRHLVGYAGQGR